MQIQNKKEKGSLLVEVIAVLGLIALITPILFHQLQRRNEDIVDTQIATEIRAVKDALSAYIQVNEKGLADDCGLICNIEAGCNGIDYKDYINSVDAQACLDWDSEKENVEKYFSGDAATLDEYNVYFYAKTVPQGDTGYRPVIYAYIVQATPMSNLRRASKVASLVGLEGGVIYSGSIHGMNGAWTDENITEPENAVVATTSFDDATNSAILKDATFSHMQASNSVQAPIVAAERVGVQDILTVDDTKNCILNYQNDSVTIRENGTNSCVPFFEVNPQTKEVRLAGTIKTGITTGASNCATGLTKTSCEEKANCVWVSTCPAYKTQDSCISTAGCNWTNNACIGSIGTCVGEYLLNPSETSMVDDIKLSSRGGAKLSELLPNWILKNTTFLQFTQSSEEKTVNVPNCPTSYHPAIALFSSGSTAAQSKFKIKTDGGEYSYDLGVKENGTNAWTISFYNKLSGSIDSPISFTAQTYCVADASVFKTEAECTAAGHSWSANSCNN